MKHAMGYENFDSATKTIAGLELWKMLKKGQTKWGGSKSPVELLYALAPKSTLRPDMAFVNRSQMRRSSILAARCLEP